MRHPVTFFHRRPGTPAPPAIPGIVIAVPGPRRGPARGAVTWLLGAITIPLARAQAKDNQLSWLHALCVTAVTQTDQIAQVAPLVQRELLLSPPRFTPLDDRRAGLEFAIDLGVAFEFPLHAERVFVHVSARELCSQIVNVEPSTELPGPEAEDLSDAQARLVQAYDRARIGDHAGACELFAVLLEAPGLREDLDACHLYNYACVLAQSGQHDRAIELLREDTQRRAAPRHAALVAQLLHEPADTEAQHRIDMSLRDHLSLRDHVAQLANDPDLTPLGAARDLRNLLS